VESERRILPPNLFYTCIALMVLLRLIWPLAVVATLPARAWGVVPLVAGLWMSIWGSNRFKKARTDIKPFEEPRTLITDGLYRWSRNPMYLGFSIALAGVWILLGAITPVVGVVFFVWAADRWYIPFEERKLAKKFGNAYEEYRARTRRWI
jgi:protein-S-isoprenylcysteine O-methyltransferase Ste14